MGFVGGSWVQLLRQQRSRSTDALARQLDVLSVQLAADEVAPVADESEEAPEGETDAEREERIHHSAAQKREADTGKWKDGKQRMVGLRCTKRGFEFGNAF